MVGTFFFFNKVYVRKNQVTIFFIFTVKLLNDNRSYTFFRQLYCFLNWSPLFIKLKTQVSKQSSIYVMYPLHIDQKRLLLGIHNAINSNVSAQLIKAIFLQMQPTAIQPSQETDWRILSPSLLYSISYTHIWLHLQVKREFLTNNPYLSFHLGDLVGCEKIIL